MTPNSQTAKYHPFRCLALVVEQQNSCGTRRFSVRFSRQAHSVQPPREPRSLGCVGLYCICPHGLRGSAAACRRKQRLRRRERLNEAIQGHSPGRRRSWKDVNCAPVCIGCIWQSASIHLAPRAHSSAGDALFVAHGRSTSKPLAWTSSSEELSCLVVSRQPFRRGTLVDKRLGARCCAATSTARRLCSSATT